MTPQIPGYLLAWISTERNRPNIQIAKRFTRLKNPPVAVGQISVLIDPCAYPLLAARISEMPRIAQPMSQETQGNWVISVPFGITTPMRKDSKNGHSRGRFVRPIPVRGNPG